MNVIPTNLPGVLILEPRVFEDERGLFMETYRQERYQAAGMALPFVQDNYSQSCRNTLRGLHFQIEHPQGKLVQALRGEVFDVAVDLVRTSPTFGQWTGVWLSESNRRQLYIPPGFAHGFYVASDIADMLYKCTDVYFPQHERTLLWNDPRVNIAWPIADEPILSDKDRRGAALDEIDCYDVPPHQQIQ